MGKTKCIQYKKINEEANHDEMTRGDFEAHVKAYLKKLITTPSHADVDDYLKSHDISAENLKKMLKDSGILVQHESISANEETGKDDYKIKYNVVRKDFNKKLRNLYISNFESNIINECDGMACGEPGVQGGDMTGQYSAPAAGVIKRKMPRNIIMTNEQADYIKEAVVSGMFGDFGYDAPASVCDKNDKAMDHNNICTGDKPVGHDGR